MVEFEPILDELPDAERARIEREAAARGRSAVDYLAELIARDLDRRRGGLKSAAQGFRFVSDGDFDLDTFKLWLSRRTASD